MSAGMKLADILVTLKSSSKKEEENIQHFKQILKGFKLTPKLKTVSLSKS
jgi:hypothetical protein